MFVNKKIRCVLVHDHVLLRQGLRRLLEDEPDMEVVAEAANVEEMLQRVFEHRPDVIITDAAAFEMTPEQVQALVSKAASRTQVVFLSMQEEASGGLDDVPSQNLAARQTSAQEFLRMVRRVSIAKSVGIREDARNEHLGDDNQAPPGKRSLTGREREVLRLLAEGQTVRSAATALGLSVKTVDAHKFNLMRKLGIHNKAELVMWAIQKKVVKFPVNF
jgi:two-component system response regulator NreC